MCADREIAEFREEVQKLTPEQLREAAAQALGVLAALGHPDKANAALAAGRLASDTNLYFCRIEEGTYILNEDGGVMGYVE